MFGNNLRLTISLARVRFWLLVRQKLGWMSFLVGVGLVFLSLVTAQVSFVKPSKIFWDFSFGTMFVAVVTLSIFLGSQIYNDEKNRRTLHLLLSAGVSRPLWILGNSMGLWIALNLMLLFWFLLSGITSMVVFQNFPWIMGMQTLVLLSLEALIILQLGILVSFFVRSLIALLATGVVVFFLHSLTSLQRIFTNQQYGAFVEDSGASIVLFLGRLLPPLEWLDLKDFIGYEDSVAWSLVLSLSLVALLWALLLGLVAGYRFKKMDL